ncbi:AAA family ATPase [Chloroflexota bacterium]
MNNNSGVLLDATFVTQSLRKRNVEITSKHELTFAIMEIDCPPEVAINRIPNRPNEGYISKYFNRTSLPKQ